MMDSCNIYKSDQWPLLLIMQVCVTACMFIISSNRHRKQLQHRTECPEGEKKCYSVIDSLLSLESVLSQALVYSKDAALHEV